MFPGGFLFQNHYPRFRGALASSRAVPKDVLRWIRANPKETEILSQVAPQGDEIVLSKTTCGAFYSTNIDQVLRSLGIRDVIVAGVVTNVCVDATVQGASEHDYGVVVVEDATAAHAPQLHQHSIFTMSYRDATIKTTQEVVQLLDAL